MTQLPLHHLSIPTRRQAAADVVAEALREAGLDPGRAAGNPMIRAMVAAWSRPEIGRMQFVESCRKLGMMNAKMKG